MAAPTKSTSALFWLPSPAPSQGMVGDRNPMRLSPDQVSLAQDVIFDTDGTMRSRGAVTALQTFVGKVTGAAIVTNNSANVPTLSTMEGQPLAPDTWGLWFTTNITTNPTSLYPSFYTATANTSNFSWGFTPLNNNVGWIGSGAAAYSSYLSPALDGTSQRWNGASLGGQYSTGTVTSTLSSRTIVGVGTTWTSAMIGMSYMQFSYSGGAAGHMGTVVAVTSTTNLTLDREISSAVAGALYILISTKAIMPLYGKGLMSCNTTTTTVIGSGTRWKDAVSSTTLLVNGNLFRAADGKFVGAITSINNNTGITLAANALVNMTNEEYYIATVFTSGAGVHGFDGGTQLNAVCNESYSDRYWYGNVAMKRAGYYSALLTTDFYPNSVFFSKKNEPEIMDVTNKIGDYINVVANDANDSIRGMASTRSGLLVFRGNDTYIITGNAPENFFNRKLWNDGILNQTCYKKHENGVIWAGRKGVYYFDGTRVVTLLAGKLAKFYQRTVQSTDIDKNLGSVRAGSGMFNQYFLISYIPSSLTDLTWPNRNTTKTLNAVTLCIDMSTGAVSLLTNLYVTNSVAIDTMAGSNNNANTVLFSRTLVSSINAGDTLYVPAHTVFHEGTATANNIDTVLSAGAFTSGQNKGPDWMWETAKFTAGDATRMKFWKMLMLEYISGVDFSISVIGQPLDATGFPPLTTGTVPTTNFLTAATNNVLKRLKFLIRAPVLSIRVYPATAITSGTATTQRFKLFWYGVAGKLMRQGRAQ